MNRHAVKSFLLFGIACIMLLAGPLTALGASSSTPSDKMYFKNKKYYIINNIWGADQVSGWWQTIYHNSDSDLGWVWNWPSSTSSVKAYPSIVSGWHWTEGYTKGSGFPTRLSDRKNINTKVSYSISANGTYNAAYDIWLHNTNKASWDSAPTDEIMIWLNNTNAGPLGSYVETVSIGGHKWNVHKGYVDSGNGKGWNVYSFVRTSNVQSASLNIRDFTNYLADSKKWLSKTKYVSSVEFGTEIFGGTGQINISNWDVTVR